MAMDYSKIAEKQSHEISNKQYFFVIAACSGLAACALGLIVNVNGIFFGPVSEALQVGRGAVSLAATLTAITTGFMGPASIRVLQRYSIKKILRISVIITAFATVGMALTNQIWVFDVLSVIRGASSAFFGIPVLTLLMGNWFVKKRGMLTGIVMSCSGVVGAILSPVLSSVIAGWGYKTGYFLCASLMILFSLPALLVLETDPEHLGGKAYGAGEVTENVASPTENETYFSYKKASVLYISLAVIAFFCQSVCSISQHLAGYGQSVGQSSMIGAVMISAAMIGNIVAKFTVGLLSDWLGAFKSAFILLAAFLLGLLCLTLFPGWQVTLFAGSFLLGTSYACALMLSNLTFAIYGTKQYGEAYAVLSVILNIGGSLAISIVGYGYDIFHSYRLILWIGSGLTILSILLLFGINKMIQGSKGPTFRACTKK